MRTPTTPVEAVEFLRTLGAPPRLLRHHELVAEAAGTLLRGLEELLPLRAHSRAVLEHQSVRNPAIQITWRTPQTSAA